jgi:hypothetical protein
MLTKIEGLPAKVIGVSAEGTVTQNDYESVLIPLLEEKHRKGERVRFLYQLAPSYSGFTAGAVWDDFKVGTKFLRLFEKCALVTDVAWIRNAIQLIGSFIPCPTKVFATIEYKDAVAWLESPSTESNLKFDLSDEGVLVLSPQGPLRREDFDSLASVVDPWIESHKQLQGVVVSVHKFPGWENFGSFIRHIEFVSSHHRKIRRIAIAADGSLPELMSKIAPHFVEAEVKQFPFDQKSEAVQWAKLQPNPDNGKGG